MSATAFTSSSHLHQLPPMLASPRRSTGSTSATASKSSSHRRQPTPMLSSKRSTSSTSTTAFTSSGHLCQPTLMLPPRGEAPTRRAPLHPTAAVALTNQHRCSPRREAPARRAPLPSPGAALSVGTIDFRYEAASSLSPNAGTVDTRLASSSVNETTGSPGVIRTASFAFWPSLDVFSVTTLPASIGAGASEPRTWDLDGPTPQA